MADDGNDRVSETRRREDETIGGNFRNGSLTAISVVVGFSLSFLTRWAGLPGPWLTADLVALVAIIGYLALASLLSTRSLLLRNHNRAVRLFLIGLASVASGVVFVIVGDLVGYGKRLLGE